MKNSSFLVKASFLATLIASGQIFAQTLPDEINHPQYLKVFQGLDTILKMKIAEYTKLAGDKAELEKLIAQMEQDQVSLPARNDELRRQINGKQQELAQVESDLRGVEGVLNKVLEDLNKLDAMLGQLQVDIQEKSVLSGQLQGSRNQWAQEVARAQARLQKEINDENQSVQILNRLGSEITSTTQNLKERGTERTNLVRTVDTYKRDLPGQRNQLNQTTATLNNSKAQLTQTQGKIPGVRAEIVANQSKVNVLETEIKPKTTKLKELKSELASRQPEVVKLEKENSDINGKIKATKDKMAAIGLSAKLAKKTQLEDELSGATTQLERLSADIVAKKEAMKGDLGRQLQAKQELREAQRTHDQAKARRLQLEIDTLEKKIAPARLEIARTEKQHETLSISIAPKKNELKAITDSIPALEVQVAALQSEITKAKDKIKANSVVIAEHAQANAGLIKEISDLEGGIKTLTAQKEALSRTVTTLEAQENTLKTQVGTLTADIQRLERDAGVLTTNVRTMETEINNFPASVRRLDLNIQKLNEMLVQKRNEALRESKLLERIRQDRVAAEGVFNQAQGTLGQVDQDIAQNNRLIRALQTKVGEENQNREVLTRYNQETIRKYDNFKAQKAKLEKSVADANREIGINDQDIATIASELPRNLTSLGLLNPKVAAAENSMSRATSDADAANTQYQTRFSLYQTHLAAAQSLGSERAGVASIDGDKAGKADAKTQAVKIATENAASHGKWEALLRGYVRGEIAGYEVGYDQGLNSESDASRGDSEGRSAGLKRAQNQADMVMKPQFYVEEMDRRLQEIEVPKKAGGLVLTNQQVMKALSAKHILTPQTVEIPALSADELNHARSIVTSLDVMINQAAVEIRETLNRRTSLSVPRNAYSILSTGANAQNPDCTGVYKDVKDFVDACKAMYGNRYQLLFGAAHYNSFVADYPSTFLAQIETTFNSELNRLYQGYLHEASSIGQQVGQASGQKEIFRQSFDRAEKSSYALNLPLEEQRVTEESSNLVTEFLSRNAALAIRGNAQLTSNSIYGISPGTQADLSMVMKNIGSVPSLGDSIVKITEVSQGLILDRREAPVSSVAARSASNVGIMRVTLGENTIPGSRVVLAGQIIHPGNHYRANRVETFRIETILNVNPSVTTTFEYDNEPKVAGIFGGIKVHEIGMKISPQFVGVNGYEITLEEVGTNFVTVITKPIQTGALAKGKSKEVSLEYKMSKAAKGKTITLKVSAKHDSKIVESYDLKMTAR